MRTRFDRELETLNLEMIQMGSLIERSIESTVQALIEKDVELAQEVIGYDKDIDDMEREIETRCLRLLLQQQPVAADLRLISTALKMITDMERIGDNAADIGEITCRIAREDYIKELRHIPMMAEATIRMVKGSVDAFVHRDLEKAQQVIDTDDEVDDLFEEIKAELIGMIHQDADCGAQAVDFLMVSKYLERIGDHAVNIAEWVVFSLTGEHKNHRIL